MKTQKYYTLKEIKICCIYFLFKNEELIYIGQTTDLHSRLASHLSDKEFDKFRIIMGHPDVLAYYEQRLIAFFKPKLNSHYGRNRVHPFYKQPEHTVKKETKPMKKRGKRKKIKPNKPKVYINPVLTVEAIARANRIILQGLSRIPGKQIN